MRCSYYRYEKQCLIAGVAHTCLLKVVSFLSANNFLKKIYILYILKDLIAHESIC
jgi:hypothetical protein